MCSRALGREDAKEDITSQEANTAAQFCLLAPLMVLRQEYLGLTTDIIQPIRVVPCFGAISSAPN